MSEDTGEGKQVQLLRVIMRKAMEDLTDGFPFAEALAGVPNIKKSKLKVITKVLKKEVSTSLEESIDTIIKTEDIDSLLKKREELIEAQKSFEGTIAWRPTGSVDDDMRSYHINVLKSKRKQSTVLLEKEEQEVEKLFSQVLETRRKVKECQMQLNASQGDVKKLQEALQTEKEAQTHIANSLNTLGQKTS